MPGLITPVAKDERWLVDGGLTNPVPVSLCRAMGADSVIAVDLNTTLLGRRITSPESAQTIVEDAIAADQVDSDSVDEGGVLSVVQSWASELRDRLRGDPRDGEQDVTSSVPSIYDVVANSINIMQVRITRSRMAGDPPDLLVTPRLADFALLDIDRAGEAIEEGRRALQQSLSSGA
jgi:NTE family protein